MQYVEMDGFLSAPATQLTVALWVKLDERAGLGLGMILSYAMAASAGAFAVNNDGREPDGGLPGGLGGQPRLHPRRGDVGRDGAGETRSAACGPPRPAADSAISRAGRDGGGPGLPVRSGRAVGPWVRLACGFESGPRVGLAHERRCRARFVSLLAGC